MPVTKQPSAAPFTSTAVGRRFLVVAGPRGENDDRPRRIVVVLNWQTRIVR